MIPVDLMNTIRESLGLSENNPYHVNPPGRPANVMPNGTVLRASGPRIAENVEYLMVEDEDGNEVVHMHMQRTESGRCRPTPTPIHRALPLAVHRDREYKRKRAARGRFTGVFRFPVHAS